MADLSVYLTVAVLNTFPTFLTPKECADLRFLQAVALVESGANPLAEGDGGKAKGAWQMHKAAWMDANRYLKAQGKKTYPWSKWTCVDAQRETALAYVLLLQDRFEMDGNNSPTPRELYLAYTMGYAGYKKAKESGTIPWVKADAAMRVDNIFRDAR